MEPHLKSPPLVLGQWEQVQLEPTEAHPLKISEDTISFRHPLSLDSSLTSGILQSPGLAYHDAALIFQGTPPGTTATSAGPSHTAAPQRLSVEDAKKLHLTAVDVQTKAVLFHWQEYRSHLLRRFSSSLAIRVSLNFDVVGASKVPQVEPSASGVVASKAKQEDILNRLKGINDRLAHAWARDERLAALRLAAEAAKFLESGADTAEYPLAFYPSLFVLVTEILDSLGALVWERLRSKAETCMQLMAEGNSRSNNRTSLPYSFSAEDVPAEAMEIAENWFKRIEKLQDPIPCLYLEIALLRCAQFIGKSSPLSRLQRLSTNIRSLLRPCGPVAVAYARLYLVRCALCAAHSTPELHLTLRKEVKDQSNLHKTISMSPLDDDVSGKGRKVQGEPGFISVMEPVLEYLVKCLVESSDEDSLGAWLDSLAVKDSDLGSTWPLARCTIQNLPGAFLASSDHCKKAVDIISTLCHTREKRASCFEMLLLRLDSLDPNVLCFDALWGLQSLFTSIRERASKDAFPMLPYLRITSCLLKLQLKSCSSTLSGKEAPLTVTKQTLEDIHHETINKQSWFNCTLREGACLSEESELLSRILEQLCTAAGALKQPSALFRLIQDNDRFIRLVNCLGVFDQKMRVRVCLSALDTLASSHAQIHLGPESDTILKLSSMLHDSLPDNDLSVQTPHAAHTIVRLLGNVWHGSDVKDLQNALDFVRQCRSTFYRPGFEEVVEALVHRACAIAMSASEEMRRLNPNIEADISARSKDQSLSSSPPQPQHQKQQQQAESQEQGQLHQKQQQQAELQQLAQLLECTRRCSAFCSATTLSVSRLRPRLYLSLLTAAVMLHCGLVGHSERHLESALMLCQEKLQQCQERREHVAQEKRDHRSQEKGHHRAQEKREHIAQGKRDHRAEEKRDHRPQRPQGQMHRSDDSVLVDADVSVVEEFLCCVPGFLPSFPRTQAERPLYFFIVIMDLLGDSTSPMQRAGRRRVLQAMESGLCCLQDFSPLRGASKGNELEMMCTLLHPFVGGRILRMLEEI